MPPIGDLTILVPVDVSAPEPPALSVLDVLRPFEVVLLGYFHVPDQAEPALIKGEYEAEAQSRLDAIAAERPDVTEVLVFTHDRAATIDRVADQYDCDAVLSAGDTDHIERVLVPVRGPANLERLTSVVAGLLDDDAATATVFHAVGDDGEVSEGEALLEEVVERVAAFGIDADRIERQLSREGEPGTDIVDLAASYDIVVLGETEPSLRDRIIGETLSDIIDRLSVPALVVRDVE